MPGDAQRDVITFLSTPEAYGPGFGPIERIDTHISIVWLAGDRAVKLKRAVRFDYVDFSTIELRRVACQAEVCVNRRHAPALYRGAVAVTRQPDGGLAIGGDGEPIDWLVDMTRFDQETLLDRLAERGRLPLSLMEPLAEAVTQWHAGARICGGRGGRAASSWVVDGNERSFREDTADVLDPALAASVSAGSRAAIERHAVRLDARSRAGLLRQCHGDLHLRNIYLNDGAPTIFDAVEFNDDISCIDVLYDLAFLLMDLWRRDLRGHANAVFNAYLAATADIPALCLLPLFLSCRAAVRAKTNVAASRVQTDERRRADLHTSAREYLDLAQRLLQPAPPRLIAIGGFSGSGKSTLSRGLAPDLGAVPGALIVRSDDVRKRMLGVPPLTRLGPAGYSPTVSRRAYDAVNARALAALEAGHTVIADAVFADPRDRVAIEAVARQAGVPFAGLWIEVPRDVLNRRLAARPLDVSDATVDVLADQLCRGSGQLDWSEVDGAGDAVEVSRRARAMLAPTRG